MDQRVKHRRRGHTRISSKNQVTLPVQALLQAGLKPGDRLRAEASGPGRISLVLEDDPLVSYAGRLDGVYAVGEIDILRREWD